MSLRANYTSFVSYIGIPLGCAAKSGRRRESTKSGEGRLVLWGKLGQLTVLLHTGQAADLPPGRSLVVSIETAQESLRRTLQHGLMISGKRASGTEIRGESPPYSDMTPEEGLLAGRHTLSFGASQSRRL